MNIATKQTFGISGMTCEACEYKIKYVFGQIEGVESVETLLDTGNVLIEASREIGLEELENSLKPYPKYSVSNTIVGKSIVKGSVVETYYPLFLIFAFITVIALLTSADLSHFLHNFMAGFFLAFSFFKLLDLKAFAQSFAMYDLLAMRLPVYGKIYPFLELTLGLLCLVHYQPTMVYIADILLMGSGSLGVIRSVLDKKQIKCACLGTVFSLPMSTITIIENTIMVLIGIVLLVIT